MSSSGASGSNTSGSGMRDSGATNSGATNSGANNSGLALRPLDAGDSALLLAWRNDPAARAASHHQDLVTEAVHGRWFAASLANPDRRIVIAERDGVPAGMARLDREGPEAWQLSWYVAPAERGRGTARWLVGAVLAQTPGEVRAEVKVDNPASARVAEAAGLRQVATRDGVLHFER